jgi:hypothetical protein
LTVDELHQEWMCRKLTHNEHGFESSTGTGERWNARFVGIAA